MTEPAVPKPWYKKPTVWAGALTLLAMTLDDVAKMGFLPEWWQRGLGIAGGLALVFASKIKALAVLLFGAEGSE